MWTSRSAGYNQRIKQHLTANKKHIPTKPLRNLFSLCYTLSEFHCAFHCFSLSFFMNNWAPQTNFRSFGGMGVVSLIRSILWGFIFFFSGGKWKTQRFLTSRKNCHQSGKSLPTWHQTASKIGLKQNTTCQLEDPENSLDWMDRLSSSNISSNLPL